MTNRERIITALLENHAALVDPMQSRSGIGDGEPLPLCPPTYTASVKELERLLRVMRDSHDDPLLTLPGGERVSVRKCWWHLNAWYLTSVVVTVSPPKRPKKRRELHRDQLTDDGKRLPVRVVRRDPAARSDVAVRGVQWLAESWALRNEPMLPADLLAA